MRDIGGFVWIVFVLFAVISSIVRSARRARGVSSSLNSQVNRSSDAPTRNMDAAARVQNNPQLVQLIRQFEQQAQAVAAAAQPQAAPPPPPPAPAPPPAPPIVPAVPRPLPQAFVPARARAQGLFGDRNALIRGIIAAEVLGKPLALRDE